MMGAIAARRIGKRSVGYLGLILLAAAMNGCPSGLPPVNDPAYASLDSIRDSGESVARVYATPIPGLPARHTWFVIKRADWDEFRRWEVFIYNGGIYGYVFRDLFPPEADLGAGGTQVIAEVRGPEAEPLIDCIDRVAAEYPCRDYYVFYPGPNSDSYTQWVLNQCGWDVELPDDVIGKDVTCPFSN